MKVHQSVTTVRLVDIIELRVVTDNSGNLRCYALTESGWHASERVPDTTDAVVAMVRMAIGQCESWPKCAAPTP